MQEISSFTVVIVCLIAGAGAGLGTGFAGMSAAAVISPMLITFLKMDPYTAVGIALASDVLASATSAYTYGKKGNIDIKNGMVMLVAVLIFTFLGSLFASNVDSSTMGNFSTFVTLGLGIKFIIKPVNNTNAANAEQSATAKIIKSIIAGTIIGIICGFVGAGGGMMMLIILTSILGYELKTAVGTSVFIMTFTALTGAVSHFMLDTMPPLAPLLLCMLFTLIFARIAANFANIAPAEKLNRATGYVLTTLAIVILIANYLS
ncbi:MAG: sulfite exporter TauE/SafE family protein [Erysipelotrichaceae bacterium]